MSSGTTTAHLERCLKLLKQGDATARTKLLEFASKRLRVLADRVFLSAPQIRGLEQRDDVLQEAQLRLWQALERVHPTSVAGFMGLAAVHTRFALIDLIRKILGHGCDRPPICYGDAAIDLEPDQTGDAPDALARLTEFHTAAAELPEPYRTTFDLLYYEGLPQAEAADLMGISLRQTQRNWRDAQLKLYKMLEDSSADDE